MSRVEEWGIIPRNFLCSNRCQKDMQATNDSHPPQKSSLSIIKIVRIELANYRGSFNTLIFKENKPSIGFCHEGRLGRRVVLTSQPEASNFVAQLSSLGRRARKSSSSDSAVQPSVASSEP